MANNNTVKIPIGTATVVPRGVWNVSTQYDKLNMVSYGGSVYIANRANQGITPGSSEAQGVWQFLIRNGYDSTVEIGTVKTGEPGSKATVENVGTPSNAVLNFSIPQGAPGQNTDPDAVHYTEQVLNDAQQQQARENIGAASLDDLTQGATAVASAEKLVSESNGSPISAGSSTKPVYFGAGTPQECGDSLDVDITGIASMAFSDAAKNPLRSYYGHTIAFSINPETFSLGISLIAPDNTVLDTKSVNLQPWGNMVFYTDASGAPRYKVYKQTAETAQGAASPDEND